MSSAQLEPASLPALSTRLRDRRTRDELQLFQVERFGDFVRAADSGADVAGMIVCMKLITNALVQMIVRRARKRGVPSLNVAPDVFRKHAGATRASGIIAIVRQRWTVLRDCEPKGIWLAIDSIRSAGNLGCIMRTCEAAGVEGIALVGQSIDPYAPDVIGSSMGAPFGLRFARTTLPELATWSRRSGVPIIGSSPNASVAWDRLTFPDPMVLWLGDERNGMSADAAALCAESVRIPIVGRGDSLNVATAAGVLIYEAVRQRRARASIPVPSATRVASVG